MSDFIIGWFMGWGIALHCFGVGALIGWLIDYALTGRGGDDA